MKEIKIGIKAPNFTLQDQDGQAVSLKDFAGQKVILFFYPKDDTPTCTIEACNLALGHKKLEKLGYKVIGISKDTPKRHTNFINKYDLPYTLLADVDTTVNQLYGLWVEKKLYGRAYMGTARTTLILDEKHKIKHIIDKVDAQNHTQQILDLISK